jgi:DeoR family deoxyribose operon repressor
MFEKRRKRIDKILALLEVNESLHIRDVAQMLEVSEMTLRRDIARGDKRLLYLGGHLVKPGSNQNAQYSLDSEKAIGLKSKRWVGRLAAEQIRDGDCIFIDCGTTMPHVVAAMPKDIECTVICYSSNIAYPLASFPNVTLVLLGGVYYPASATFYCEESIDYLNKFGINKAFMSAGGVSLERGVSCSHLHEAKIKQAILGIAMKKILVVDSGKFGQFRSAFFSDFAQFDSLITDTGLDAETAGKISRSATELLIAQAQSGPPAAPEPDAAS